MQWADWIGQLLRPMTALPEAGLGVRSVRAVMTALGRTLGRAEPNALRWWYRAEEPLV